MSDHHFWLAEAQFSRLQPLLPNKPRGVPRVDNRRVISGIIHGLRGGLMCRGPPAAYGPHKTLYNRFVRWGRIGVFDRIFVALAAKNAATDPVMIDTGPLKAHRSAASLHEKGLFPAVSGGPKAASTRSRLPSATQTASQRSCNSPRARSAIVAAPRLSCRRCRQTR
jgi:transposase